MSGFTIRRCLLAVLMAGLAGCATSQEEMAWKIARDSGSPAGYERYLRQYPQSAHAAELRWEAARRADTVPAYLDYLKNAPAGEHAGEVKERMMAAARSKLSIGDGYAYLAWARAQGDASAEFAATNDAIRRQIKELEWIKAKDSGKMIPLFLFLQKYPDSSFAPEARNLLHDLRYDYVRKAARPFAYRAYLRFYPEGSRCAEVRSLLEKDPGGPSGAADTGVPDGKAAARDLAGKDGYFLNYGCALRLGGRIRDSRGDPFMADEWRGKLNGLFAKDAAVPAECASMEGITLDMSDAVSAAHAVRAFLGAREEQDERLKGLVSINQHVELIGKSAAAAEGLAKALEADELAESVLGSGVLGGMDLRLDEPGSVTASRAMNRLRELEALASENAAEARQLLTAESGQSDALRLYLASLLKLEAGGGE